MTSMRICLVSLDVAGPIRNGGIGTAMVGLGRLLAGAGHDVTILYPAAIFDVGTPELWRARFAAEGLRFECLMAEGGDAEISYRVHHWLKARSFDVIHFHDWRGVGYWTMAAKRQGLAHQGALLVVHVHGQTLWHKTHSSEFLDSLLDIKTDWLEQRSVETADWLISPSQYMVDMMRGKGWRMPPEIRVLQNIVDPKNVVQPAGVAETTSINREPRVVSELVFFGRLEARKGLELFCEAVSRLHDSGQAPAKVTFLGKLGMVGRQGATSYLAGASAHWSSDMAILNDRDTAEALSYLAGSGRLAVIASVMENSPYAVLECLAAGIPFLAADVGGISELIADADKPLVTFRRTIDGLADSLGRCLASGAFAAQAATPQSAVRRPWLDWHREIRPRAEAPAATRVPRISVVISTHNRALLLESCLASLEVQTVAPLEVIVVDDASTAPDAIAYLDAQHDRFERLGWQLIRNASELWPGASRNKGAQAAVGDYILFMDDDNLALPHEIETFAIAAMASGADILSCQSAGQSAACGETALAEPPAWMPIGPCLALAVYENCLGDLNMLVQRDAFVALEGFREEPQVGCEDYEFLLRAILSGLTLQTIPEALYVYRTEGDRLADRYSEAQLHASFSRVLEPLLAVVPPGVGMALRLANNMHLSAQKLHSESYWRQRRAGEVGWPPDLDDAAAIELIADAALDRGRGGTAALLYEQALRLRPRSPGLADKLAEVRAAPAPRAVPSPGSGVRRRISAVWLGSPEALVAADPDLVQSEKDGTVTIRPSEDGPTIARFRLPPSVLGASKGAELRAFMYIEDVEAGTVECAVLWQKAVSGTSAAAILAFADAATRWTRLEPGRPTPLPLVGRSRDAKAMLIATRMVDEEPAWFARPQLLWLQSEGKE